MKKIVLFMLVIFMTIFSACGDGGSTTTNTNTYNLRAINKTTGISIVLKGSSTDGVKEVSIVKSDYGTDIINGILVRRIKIDVSITYDSGDTEQQPSSIALINENGVTLASYGSPSCTLTTDPGIVPTIATIGTKSNGVARYSCDDSTNEAISWSLVDAGNSNANYVIKTIISGASQFEATRIITITPQNKIIHEKFHVTGEGMTGTFEGDVNYIK